MRQGRFSTRLQPVLSTCTSSPPDSASVSSRHQTESAAPLPSRQNLLGCPSKSLKPPTSCLNPHFLFSLRVLPENVFFNRMHHSQKTECNKFSCCCRNQDSCENVYDMSYTSKTTNLLLLCRSVPVEGQADLLPHLEDLQHHGQP